MITLSVITICYNDAAHLERTLRSVAEQKKSYPAIEYIVVDGASTDDTPAILQRHAGEIDRLISEPDSGVYDAMNKGLRAATGDYLCFLNSGDAFHAPGQIGEIFSPLASAGALPGVIYGQTNLVDEAGAFLRLRAPKAPKNLSYQSFLRGMCVCHQSFYARRDLAEEYDDRFRLSGDFDWCLAILHRSSYNLCTGRVLTDYLSEGLTTRNRLPSLKERLRIMIERYGLLPALFAHLCFLLRLPFK